MDTKERVDLLITMGRKSGISTKVVIMLKLLKKKPMTYCGIAILGTLCFLAL
jgi:hypothetical protein